MTRSAARISRTALAAKMACSRAAEKSCFALRKGGGTRPPKRRIGSFWCAGGPSATSSRVASAPPRAAGCARAAPPHLPRHGADAPLARVVEASPRRGAGVVVAAARARRDAELRDELLSAVEHRDRRAPHALSRLRDVHKALARAVGELLLPRVQVVARLQAREQRGILGLVLRHEDLVVYGFLNPLAPRPSRSCQFRARPGQAGRIVLPI